MDSRDPWILDLFVSWLHVGRSASWVQRVTNALGFCPGCVWGDLENPLGTTLAQGMLWLELALTTDDVRRHFLMGSSYRSWPAAGTDRKQRGHFKKELPVPLESSFSLRRLNWEPVAATCKRNKKNYSYVSSFQDLLSS